MAKRAPLMTPIIQYAKDVSEQPMEWLWYPYIPKDMLVMLDGDPGIGKSMMLLQIATNLSQGLPFLDQFGKPTLMPDVDGPQSTLILSAEDSLSHVMKPRLMRAGADLGRIAFFNDWKSPDGTTHAFDLQHMPALEYAIQQVKPVLVVLDPLVAYLGNIDMHRSNDTRPLMASLRTVAEKYGCTVLGIRHPSKLDQGGPLMYRGQGNMDIVGAARSALWVQRHPIHPETQSLMIHSKTNIGMPGRTVIFSREYGEFKWVGVSRLREDMFTGKGPEPFAFLECFFWLEETLTPGEVCDVHEWDEKAKKRDISPKILLRAKRALGVKTSQAPGGGWYFILPPLTHTTHTTHTPTGSTGSTAPTGSTGSTGWRDLESTTYNTTNGQHPVDPVDPVDPLHPVDPVVSREPYTCDCGNTLADNHKVCFQCGEPRSLPLF